MFCACLAQSARQQASVIVAMPQAKRFVDLAPSQILFTHDSIAETFSCGRYIDHTYEELQGDIQVEDLPMIKVKRADLSTHQYWAARGWDFDLFWAVTGNRRTWVYRKLQVAGLCNSVRCELSKKGGGLSGSLHPTVETQWSSVTSAVMPGNCRAQLRLAAVYGAKNVCWSLPNTPGDFAAAAARHIAQSIAASITA